MKNKKLLSVVLTASMLFGVSGATLTVKAETNGDFKNALPTVERQEYSSKKFTAKPLVILMDFPDYNHKDLDKKEDWRINNFKGEETTPEFYEKLFFGDDFYKTSDGKKHMTVNKFFKEESGGTYEFKGKVVGWYMADKKAAAYGANKDEGSDQPLARELVKEAITKAAKDLDLSEFDVEDKWDLDGDGNYNEPDGIIDTVVVIHPGLGEEWGGGSLGEDAIWPFRWGFNIYGEDISKLTVEDKKNLAAKNTSIKDKKGNSYKIEDFSVFEQDLPVDLFNHEYGHVLGLPDLYGFGQSEPPVENWSIMGGSYTGNPRGSQPVSYGAYCKQYLQNDFEKRGRKANWQNSKLLKLEDIDEKGMDIVLDQGSLKGKNNDCIKINLPEAKGNKIVTPPEGKNCYFSGKGDNLENYMTTKKPIDLTGKTSAELTFKTWYSIDPGFDFASVQVREVGAKEWRAVKGNLTTDKVDDWIVKNDAKSIPKRNPGHGITDSSKGNWVDAKFDLSEFKDKKIELRLRFRTDGNTPEEGIYTDELKITADKAVIFEDNAEGESKFNFDGFKKSDGIEVYNHYYLLEWRNSEADTLVDKGLSTINIGRPGLQYDPGLVIWYINEKHGGFKPSQQVKEHPGELFAGVVDADQEPVVYLYEDGRYGADKANYQMHDSAFSLRPGSELKIEGNVGKKNHYTVMDNQTFINPCFDDMKNYTASYNKQIGLNLQKYGLKVFVTDESKDRSTAKIHIAKYNNGSQVTEQESSIIKEIKTENNKVYVQTDNIYGHKLYVDYVGKYNKRRQVTLELKDGKYEGNADFLVDEKDVDWKIDYIILTDKSGNTKALYNKDIYKIFGVKF